MNTTELSIIIATRNRENILWPTIGHCLQSIADKNVEVIVVNDGDRELNPPDSTVGSIRFLNNPKRGVSSARNLGASVANADLLFFIDDDMWIDKGGIDWIIENLVKGSAINAAYVLNWEYPPVLDEQLIKTKVGRFLLNAGYNTMWGRMHQPGVKPGQGLYRTDHIASCSLVMPRQIFEYLEGYNEAMVFQGEDIDLSARLNKHSIPIYAVFDVTLLHNHQDRLHLTGFLDRLNNGYQSEFAAVKMGIIPDNQSLRYTGLKKQILDLLRISEPVWIFLSMALPNNRLIMSINNKLIGMLAGLQRYKHWHRYYSR